jgi:membrane-associated phospholipid phosphatase
MLVINTRAFAFTAALTGVIKRVANRERPVATTCRSDSSYDPSCGAAGPDYSFFSGHSSMAFTGAALICTHHAHLPLYGGDGDALACMGGVTAAILTGLARVTSDRHYLTDVLTGASVGMVSGAILPWLLHYRAQGSASAKESAGRGLFSPLIGPTTLGAAYTFVY